MGLRALTRRVGPPAGQYDDSDFEDEEEGEEAAAPDAQPGAGGGARPPVPLPRSPVGVSVQRPAHRSGAPLSDLAAAMAAENARAVERQIETAARAEADGANDNAASFQVRSGAQICGFETRLAGIIFRVFLSCVGSLSGFVSIPH